MMSIVSQSLVYIYRFVNFIFTLPKHILNKSEDAVLGGIDRQELKKSQEDSKAPNTEKELTEIDQNLKGIGKDRAKRGERNPVYSFRYVILADNGKKEKGIFEAETLEDATNFLKREGYNVVDVKPKSKFDIDFNFRKTIKNGDLAFALTQLSTYVKAGIPLVDGVRILAKQTTKPFLKRAFERLVYDLLAGDELSEAMDNQGDRFPRLLINMIKTAEMTGDLTTILDDQAEYYESIERTRKQMISAMTYPAVVLFLAFCVLIFMLVYIVPRFVDMFESQNADLPWITKAVMAASTFVKTNFVWLLLGLVGIILLFRYLFKNVTAFRKTIQTGLMHFPVVKNIIIYNEVYNFTKTFASLLNHGVYITDSMEILSKITTNEVYKEIIGKTLTNLAHGDSISSSFKGEWAFPVVAYEMLVTGESTGQLGLMMEKVAEHFQMLHKNIIDQLKSLIEPLMIAGLAAIVGVILLSIVVPMFDIYGKIQ